MPSRKLNPKKIDDLSDAIEEQILEKVKVDFRSKIEEVKENFRSQIALMKSDVIVEIVSYLGGIPRHVGT